jgi:hypothetical protein
VRSAYTAGAVQLTATDWAELVAQTYTPPSEAADPTVPGAIRPKSAAYPALPAEQQLHIFLASLPPELIRAPRIDWGRVPTNVRVYLLYGRGAGHPEWAALALASEVVATNGVLPSTVYHHVTVLATMWDHLLARYHLSSVRELTYQHWMDYGSDRQRMRQRTNQIHHYQAAALHLREYLHSLDANTRANLDTVAFPEVPAWFTERFMPAMAFVRETQEVRKAKTHVLVPLATTLVALILERKKAAQRFVDWFRSQVASVEQGELRMPADVEYRGYELDINRDAASVEDVRWVRREVRLRATLWDPRTYVQHRHDRAWLADHVDPGIPKKTRENGHDWIYTPHLPDRYFLQLTEDDSALHPWPIGIVARGGLLSHGHQIRTRSATTAGSRHRVK